MSPHPCGPRPPRGPGAFRPFPAAGPPPRRRIFSGPDEELVAGRRPVEEAFVARRPALRLLVVPQRRQALERIVLHATSLRIPIVEVEGGTLTSVAGFDGHQGIALVVRPRAWATVDDVLARADERGEPPFVLVLDSLEDPQNVGTLLRSAEARRGPRRLLPDAPPGAAVAGRVKASAGATEHLLLVPVDDLAGSLADLHVRGVRIVGADEDAPLTARQADLRGPLALVVGSEGQGIGPAVRRRLDLTVRIPMRGSIGSLNAAVAGSILLFEILEQRGDAPPAAPSDIAARRVAAPDHDRGCRLPVPRRSSRLPCGLSELEASLEAPPERRIRPPLRRSSRSRAARERAGARAAQPAHGRGGRHTRDRRGDGAPPLANATRRPPRSRRAQPPRGRHTRDRRGEAAPLAGAEARSRRRSRHRRRRRTPKPANPRRRLAPGRRAVRPPRRRRGSATAESAAPPPDPGDLLPGGPATERHLGRARRACASLDRPTAGPIISRRHRPFCGMALRADVAQLVEQRFCKPPVPGSSPVVGSN